MTEIMEDSVEIDLTIDGEDWDLIEAEVELSQVAVPNYVDLVMTPAPSSVDNLPSDITELVGAGFSLSANNELISERTTDANEDSLLFEGNLANISPTGENVYEAIAYDPGQQAFNIGAESGSVINQTIDLKTSTFLEPDSPVGEQTGIYPIKASRLVQEVLNEAGINDFEINLFDRGRVMISNSPVLQYEITTATDEILTFQSRKVPVKAALNRAREMCRAEWWFDKSGTFHFGTPEVVKHELQYITNTSAGITTPPYQSVRVIGSNIATTDGYGSAHLLQDQSKQIVQEARIARPARSGSQAEKVIVLNETVEPVFEYVNAEISTEQQAENTALKICDELAKQQASGEITVVGFPEVTPFDGLVMPQAANPEGTNYNPNQPMGGQVYGVYKVKHRLNAEDGFITKITVSGPTEVTRTAVVPREDAIATSIDRDVYRDDDARREYVSGAGFGGLAQGDGI